MSEFLPPEPIDGGIPQQSIPKKSLVLPLLIVLSVVAIGGGYVYLNTIYPNLFKNAIKNTYETIIPASQNAAKDEQPTDIIPNPTLAATPTPTPKPKHSPYPLVPDSGTAGTFKVTHSSGGGPTITDIKIDPLNAKIGDTVIVTLNLTHPSEIKNITGSVRTDTKPLSFTFNKKERQNNTEVWIGKVTLTEPFLYTYVYSFESSDDQKHSTLDMGLRSEQ